MELVYSGTPLYGHPLNTDTPILRTVLFAPTKSKLIHFFKEITAYYGHPDNTDIFAGPLGVRINGVPLYL